MPNVALRLLEVNGTRQVYATLTYQQNDDAEGASLSVEHSGDLRAWNDVDAQLVEWARIGRGDGTSSVTLRFVNPISADEAPGYLRIRGVAR